MKVLILYRPNSEHSRLVEEFIREFRARHQGEDLEVLSLDTREGTSAASVYDIVQYPAILAIQDDGRLQKNWQGTHLPLMQEVASYVYS